MEISRHYNIYWKKKKRHDTFWEYERNWVLPKMFKDSHKILDLACGDGAVSEYLLKELSLDVTGADLSSEARVKAQKRGVKTVEIDAEKPLPFSDQEFDTVFWGDNIEHLFNPEVTVQEIHRVLKKKGKLILSCPNMSYWRYRLTYLFQGNLADTEWSGNPRWRWLHIRFFDPKCLTILLEKNGFKVKKITGVSRRLPDRLILKFFPSYTNFGLIIVVEAIKK